MMTAQGRRRIQQAIQATFVEFFGEDLPARRKRSSLIEPLERRVLLSSAALWHFNETSGSTAADSSGSNNTATLYGGASFSAGRASAGNALTLNGTGYADAGNPTDLNFSGNITLSAWIMPTSTSGTQVIVAHGDTSGNDTEDFLQISNGYYQVGSWNGSYHDAQIAIASSDLNTWVHLSGQYNGSSWILYRDGTQVASSSSTVGALTASTDWVIGADANSANRQYFTGQIDDVEVDTSPLTIGQIQTLAGVPSSWSDADIGSPSVSGGSSFDGTNWVVSGAGSDIAGASDQFNFASESFTGNGSAVAEVTAQTNSNSWAKAGVMFRSSTSATSAFAGVFITPSNGIIFEWRSTSGATYSDAAATGVSVPQWVKLTRFGDSFSAFYSSNGSTWTQVGVAEGAAIGSTALTGLAITSHNTAALSQATFTNVAVTTTTVSVPTGWSDRDIGSPAMSGAANFDGTTWTQAAGGSGIAGTSDQFNFASESFSGNGNLVAEVTSQTNSNASAKAGIMFRNDTTVGGAYAAVFVTPSSGIVFQWRSTSGGATSTTTVSGITAPQWLMLSRLGDSFTAYYSANGTSWTQVGVAQGAVIGSTALAGLATTSSNANAITQATFTNVAITSASSLPSGWSDGDIGSPTMSGAAVYSGSTWTLAGGGSGIAGTSDQFNFANQSFSGNGSIVGEITSQTGSNASAEAGLMFRNDTTAGGAYAAVFITPSNGVVFQWRATSGGATSTTTVSGIAAPQWLLLSRLGNSFTAAYSANGTTWTQVGIESASVSSSALAGLAVTASNGSAISQATFTNVALTSSTPSSLPSGWGDADVGSPAMAGSANFDGTTWTVDGGGADIAGSSDQFNFASESFSGNGSIIAEVTSQTNTSASAKAGVMFRNDSTAGASYAGVFITPSNGITFQWRTTAGASSSAISVSGISPPQWVKLTRLGGTFIAYYSANGTSWTQIGAEDAELGSTALAGLTVTSHNTAALSQATFTNVAITAAPSLPSGWSDSDIGSSTVPGGASFDGTNWTLASSGVLAADENGAVYQGANTDAFNFAYTSLGSNQQIVAQVGNELDLNTLSKAGLMLRATSSASSAFAGIFVTPGWGVVMIDRSSSGVGATSPAYDSSYSLSGGPLWLKLTDQSGVVTGYVSIDDSNWSQIGQLSLSLGSSPFVGLAADGGGGTSAGLSSFSNVSLGGISSATLVPEAPYDLTTDSFSAVDGRVVWKPMSGLTSITVQQSSNGGSSYQTVATIPGWADTFLPSNLSANTNYLFRIQANAASGTSPWSSPAAIDTTAASTRGYYVIDLGAAQSLSHTDSDSMSATTSGASVYAASWEQAMLLTASGTASNNTLGASYSLGNFTALASGGGYYGNSFGFNIVQDPYVAFNDTAGDTGANPGQNNDVDQGIDWVQYSLQLTDPTNANNSLTQSDTGPGFFSLYADPDTLSAEFDFSVTDVTDGGPDYDGADPTFHWTVSGGNASPAGGDDGPDEQEQITLTAPNATGTNATLSVGVDAPAGTSPSGPDSDSTVDIAVLYPQLTKLTVKDASDPSNQSSDGGAGAAATVLQVQAGDDGNATVDLSGITMPTSVPDTNINWQEQSGDGDVIDSGDLADSSSITLNTNTNNYNFTIVSWVGPYDEGSPSDGESTRSVPVEVIPTLPPPTIGNQVSMNDSQMVDIHGVPLPDPSPTGQGESDRIPNMASIDAATLTPTFSTTDVSVPMPGDDLTMEFRRTEGIGEQTIQTQGTNVAGADYQWSSGEILGPGWSTNIASRIVVTATSSPSAGQAPYEATVFDDIGNAVNYASDDGANYVADVTNNFSAEALRGTLQTGVAYGGVTYSFCYTEEHGTRLFYSYVGFVNRGGPDDNYYRLSKVVDPNGNEIDYGYNASDPTLVTSMYDPTTASRQITFAYTDMFPDADGGGWRLTSVTDPLSQEYDYNYNSGGELISVEKPAVANPTDPTQMGRPTTNFTYTSSLQPRILVQSDGSNPWDSGEYTAWTLPSTITDPNNTTTSFQYAERLEPTAIESKNGAPVGLWENKYELTQVTTPDGTANFTEVSRTFTTAETQVTDTTGATTTYNFTGSIVAAPNTLGFAIVTTQVTRSVNVANVDGNISTDNVTYDYAADLTGDLIKVIDISGVVTEYNYNSGVGDDPYNQSVPGTTFTHYQIHNEPAEQIVDDGGAGHLNLTTQYRYDTQYSKLIEEIDPAGEITKYTLDAHGNRIQAIQAFGTPVQTTTNYTYNSRGFETSMVDPDGRETDYIPNQFGNLQFTVVKGMPGEDLTPLATSSPFPTIDPDHHWIVTERIADVVDNTLESIDANGGITSYTLDNLNRVVETSLPPVENPSDDENGDPLTDPQVTPHTYTYYDYDSNVIESIDANGNATVNTYDAMDRKISSRVRMSTPTGNSTSDLVTKWTYTPVGLVAQTTDPDGNVTQYKYDALLRLIETIEPTVTIDADPTSDSDTPALTTATYDTKEYYGANSGSGAFMFSGFNPTKTVDANGDATNTIYDAAYRPTSVSRPLGAETDYVYNADGKVIETTVKDEVNGVAQNRSTYTFYDDLERPTVSLVDMNGNGSGIVVGQYVDNAATFSAPANDLTTRSQYDGAGHVIAVTDPDNNTSQTKYDGDGRVVQQIAPAVSVFIPGTGTETVSPTTTTVYDGNSNPILATDPDGSQTETQYDAENRAVRTILDLNRDGVFDTTQGAGATDIVNVTGYDLNGNKLYTIDPNGDRTDMRYDADNREVLTLAPAVADASAGGAMSRPQTQTQYDADGNVISVTDPRGLVTDKQYDALNRLRFTTVNAAAAAGSSDQLVTENRYDGDGNVIGSVVYDWLDGVESPQVTLTNYDALNRKTSQTEPDPTTGAPGVGPSVSYAYDEAGNLLSTTDARGNTTSYTYDLDNRKLTMVQPSPDGTAPPLTTRYVYDNDGNTVGMTDPREYETEYFYDADNRKIEQIDPDPTTGELAAGPTTHQAYDADGNPTESTDARGNSTETYYDAANRKIETIQPDPSTGATGAGPTVNYSYDPDGNQIGVTDQLSHTTEYFYDALNRKIETIQPDPATGAIGAGPSSYIGYDLDGNVFTQTDARNHVTTTYYDGMNRSIEVVQPAADGNASAAGPTTYSSYDPAGNLLSTTDPRGFATTYAYDNLNRKISETDPAPTGAGAGLTTSYTYDANNNELSVTDPRSETTTYQYDALNRKTEEIQPVPQAPFAAPTTLYAYNADGDLLSETDPDSNVTSYTYDALDRQTSVTNPLGTSSSVYDANGNVISAVDADGNLTTYSFDALNRQVSEVDADDITSVYNAKGLLLSVTDSDSTTTYQYDDLDRPTVITLNYNQLSQPITLSLGYDADGNRNSLSATVGGTPDLLNNYDYDALNRLTQIQQGANGGDAVADKQVDLTYDADGNLNGSSLYSDLTGTNLVASSTSGYDDDNRQTSLDYTLSGGSSGTPLDYTLAYDAASRLVTQTNSDGTNDYTYDNDNQLLSASRTDESYAYDAAGNRDDASDIVLPGNQLIGDGTYNYWYNANGDLTSQIKIGSGGGENFTWDNRNRLTWVNFVNAAGTITGQIHYTYAPNGNNRISQTVLDANGNEVSQEFYVYDDNNNLLMTVDSDAAVTERYLSGNNEDQYFAEETNISGSATGQTKWMLSDTQGSVRDVVDNTGTVINHIDYDSYGNILTQTNASNAVRIGYTGMQTDVATGMDYDHARYYDPFTGRFLSDDPKGFAGGDSMGNLYRYVDDNPLDRTDPTGMDTITDYNDPNSSLSLDSLGNSSANAQTPSVQSPVVPFTNSTDSSMPTLGSMASTPIGQSQPSQDSTAYSLTGNNYAGSIYTPSAGDIAQSDALASATTPMSYGNFTQSITEDPNSFGPTQLAENAAMYNQEYAGSGSPIAGAISTTIASATGGWSDFLGATSSYDYGSTFNGWRGVGGEINTAFNIGMTAYGVVSGVAGAMGETASMGLAPDGMTTGGLPSGEYNVGGPSDAAGFAGPQGSGMLPAFPNQSLSATPASNAPLPGDPMVPSAPGADSGTQITFQTYTKTNPDTGVVYSGRTSGTGTPLENVAARDEDHHMDDLGFGPAVLDMSSTSYYAIRGREQDLIWQNGGAQSEGGTSGNAYNGIRQENPNFQLYLDASEKEFGIGE